MRVPTGRGARSTFTPVGHAHAHQRRRRSNAARRCFSSTACNDAAVGTGYLSGRFSMAVVVCKVADAHKEDIASQANSVTVDPPPVSVADAFDSDLGCSKAHR